VKKKLLKFPRHKNKEIRAKGRNGQFDPREVYVIDLEPGIIALYAIDPVDNVALAVSSRRAGVEAPIYLVLPRTEMRQVAEAIIEVCDGGQEKWRLETL
jgi:hypothetical protein